MAQSQLSPEALFARIIDRIGTKEISTPREAVALVVDSYLAALGFVATPGDDAFSSTYTLPQSDDAIQIDISAPFQRINFATYAEETAIAVTGRSRAASGDVDTFTTVPLHDLLDSSRLPWIPRADASRSETIARLAELFAVRPPGSSSLMESSSATSSSVSTLLQGVQAYLLQPLVPSLSAPGYTSMQHYGSKWPSYGTGVATINENKSYGAFLTGKNIGDLAYFQSLQTGAAAPDADAPASKTDTQSGSAQAQTTRDEPPRDQTREQARNEAEAAAAADAFRRNADSGPALARAHPADTSADFAPPDHPPPGRGTATAATPAAPAVDFAPPSFDDEHQMARTLGPHGTIGDSEPLAGTGHSDLHQPNMGPNDPLRRFLPGPGAGVGGVGGVGGDSGLGVGPGGFSGMHPTFSDPLFRNSRPRPGFGQGGQGQGYPNGPPPGARYDDPMGETNDELGGYGGFGAPGGLGGGGGPGFPGSRGPRGGFGGGFGGGFSGGFGSGGGSGGFGGGGII